MGEDSHYLTLKDVTKAFGGLRALDHLTLEMREGELVSIIGPNGAGKTTLLNLISGILPISGGEIWFQGKRIDDLPPYEICRLGISRTFQDLQLFNNMSVLENVMIGSYMHTRASFLEAMLRLWRVKHEERRVHDHAMEILSVFGLEDRAHDMPSSLALKDRSYLAIARALSTDPELVLLDEPVAGLMVEEINETSDTILKLRETGLNILFIEHRMELVMGISEKVIVMDFGRKIAEGSFAEIQRNEKVIAAYLGNGSS